MGLAHFLLPTLIQRIAEAIPDPDPTPKPGTWTARRAFQSLMGLVRPGGYVSIARMLERQSEQGQFPDFADVPSASGFSQGRHLLKTSDCKAAWMRARDLVDPLVGGSERRWIAIDGSWIVTSRSRSARARWTTPTGGKLPQAIAVTAWEVRTRLPVGFCVLARGQGERVGAQELLPHLRAGDIALMDRGFPSEWLIGALVAQRVDIVARMTTGATAWAETAAFVASGKQDAELPVEVRRPDGTAEIITLRFIRRAFPRGRPKLGQSREAMILITTLLDREAFPAEAIIARYHERWGVETAYREMKITFAIERFHSPEAESIVQELYALMAWLCLAAAMQAHVHQLLVAKRGKINPEDPERYQINRTSLFVFVDQAFWAACSTKVWNDYRATFDRHCQHLVRYAQKRRPGRSTPRERLAPFGHFAGG
jgi:hypothetical protein